MFLSRAKQKCRPVAMSLLGLRAVSHCMCHSKRPYIKVSPRLSRTKVLILVQMFPDTSKQTIRQQNCWSALETRKQAR